MGLPLMLVGDVTADGRADLLLQHDADELRVFLGTAERGVFERRYQRLTMPLADPARSWLVDLDGDGRQDLVMHHVAPGEPCRVTTVMARPGSES